MAADCRCYVFLFLCNLVLRCSTELSTVSSQVGLTCFHTAVTSAHCNPFSSLALSALAEIHKKANKKQTIMNHQPTSQSQATMDVCDPSELNRKGISCLLEGRSQDAVQCFKHALVTMKASLYRIPKHLKLPTLLVQSRPLYRSINIPDTSEERFHIYICAHALEFPSKEGAIEEQDYPLYSALVMFNIGLAYNLRSQKGIAEERSLKDAAYFYSISMKILTSLQAHCKSSILAPVKLAVLNNLATILYEQGNARMAYETLGQAYEILSSSDLLTQDDAVHSGFLQSDFDGISLNAVMMKMTFVAPCA